MYLTRPEYEQIKAALELGDIELPALFGANQEAATALLENCIETITATDVPNKPEAKHGARLLKVIFDAEYARIQLANDQDPKLEKLVNSKEAEFHDIYFEDEHLSSSYLNNFLDRAHLLAHLREKGNDHTSFRIMVSMVEQAYRRLAIRVFEAGELSDDVNIDRPLDIPVEELKDMITTHEKNLHNLYTNHTEEVSRDLVRAFVGLCDAIQHISGGDMKDQRYHIPANIVTCEHNRLKLKMLPDESHEALRLKTEIMTLEQKIYEQFEQDTVKINQIILDADGIVQEYRNNMVAAILETGLARLELRYKELGNA